MKKKGSALILSILMLSFFMTITLTMYYVARNRNQRSIYKVKGMKISSGLDTGTAIAHYELYLADEYVSKGHLYETSGSAIDYRGDNAVYSIPTTTTRYTSEITSGGVITIVPQLEKHYTGVVLNNYNEYFGASWNATTGAPIQVSSGSSITDNKILRQPWVAEDKVIDGKIVSRAWLNNSGEKIVRLWTLDHPKDHESAISLGGYRLIDINGKTLTNADMLKTVFDAVTGSAIRLTYEKVVSIDKTTIGDTGTENYRITYVEKVTTSGGSIVADELENMTVEKLK